METPTYELQEDGVTVKKITPLPTPDPKEEILDIDTLQANIDLRILSIETKQNEIAEAEELNTKDSEEIIRLKELGAESKKKLEEDARIAKEIEEAKLAQEVKEERDAREEEEQKLNEMRNKANNNPLSEETNQEESNA